VSTACSRALTLPVGATNYGRDKWEARAQRVASRHAQMPSAPIERIEGASLLVPFLWRDREKLLALAGRIPAAVHRVAKALRKSGPLPVRLLMRRPASTPPPQRYAAPTCPPKPRQ